MKIALMPNLSKQNAHTYTVRIIKRLLELQCEIFLYAKYRDYFDIQTIHFYEDFFEQEVLIRDEVYSIFDIHGKTNGFIHFSCE